MGQLKWLSKLDAWSLGITAELARLESNEREHELLKEALTRPKGYSFLVFIATTLGLLYVSNFTVDRIPALQGSKGYWGAKALRLLIFLTLGIPIGLAVNRLRSRKAQSIVRRRLNELGHPTCMQCGFDLRGTDEGRCPECGAIFKPAIQTDSQ